jgi:hypothetical protein
VTGVDGVRRNRRRANRAGLPVGIQIVRPHLEDSTTIDFAARMAEERRISKGSWMLLGDDDVRSAAMFDRRRAQI